MKKILITLLLILSIISGLFAATGTVVLSYENGNVSYTETQTFYEIDVLVYISGGESDARFFDGQVYVEYDSTIFGDSTALNLSSVTLRGPLAFQEFPRMYDYYSNNTLPNAFSITFEASDPENIQYYTSGSYISNSSGSPDTLMTIKMEVIASGTSTVNWPSSVTGINSLYHDLLDWESTFNLSIANATETTEIAYSDTGEPALPIELKSFEVQYENSAVAVKWTTESETENLGYVVKRAVIYGENDMSSYEVIGSYLEHDELLGQGTTVERNSYVFYDKNVKPGVNYSYILEDVDYNGVVTSHGTVSIVVPEDYLVENTDYRIGRSFPNPFNPSFTIPFELMTAMDVNISMYDITGRKILTITDGYFEPRQYQFRVDASSLNSGIYFVRTIIGNEVNTQKMTLLK